MLNNKARESKNINQQPPQAKDVNSLFLKKKRLEHKKVLKNKASNRTWQTLALTNSNRSRKTTSEAKRSN